MTALRDAALHFEAVKVALRQSKDGVMLTLSIHPNDMKGELWQHHIGSRYMVALVKLNDQDQPETSPQPAVATGSTAEPATNGAAGGAGEKRPATPEQKALKRCAVLCTDPEFQRWLSNYPEINRPLTDEYATAEAVRTYLDGSRSRIATNPGVYQRWLALVGDFDDWRRYGDRR